MIPKILHQFWIGEKQQPTEWMDTWKKLNPDWEYILWDDAKIKDFKLENQHIVDYLWKNPHLGKIEYHGIKDVYQYEILKKYGGFFVDADAICLRPIPDYLLRFPCFTCYESERNKPGYLALGYVGAEPNHPVFDKCIQELKKMTKFVPAWSTIGQLHWTNMAQNRNDVLCLPSTFFIPVHYTNTINGGDSKSYATQFWGSTLGLYKNS